MNVESKNGDSVHISPNGDNHINVKGEGEQIIGDGSTAVDFESISGDLVIKKAG